jgi:Uma2 family endonuclease
MPQLIDGEIVEMAPVDWHHHAPIMRLHRTLNGIIGPSVLVSIKGPLLLDEHSEVQPDVVLLRPRPDAYKLDLPKTNDVLLVVEVGASSARFDHQIKAPLYARNGIPDFWLADLDEDDVKVFRDPTPEGYRATWAARRGDRIAPLAFPEQPIAVDDILG